MYNRYQGNTGRFVRVPDAEPQAPPTRQRSNIMQQRNEIQQHRPGASASNMSERRGQAIKAPPQTSGGGLLSGLGGGLNGLLSGLGGGLGGLFSPKGGERGGQPQGGISGIVDKLLPDGLETEDLLLLLIIYLMYRESGDKELLVILGAMFLL